MPTRRCIFGGLGDGALSHADNWVRSSHTLRNLNGLSWSISEIHSKFWSQILSQLATHGRVVRLVCKINVSNRSVDNLRLDAVNTIVDYDQFFARRKGVERPIGGKGWRYMLIRQRGGAIDHCPWSSTGHNDIVGEDGKVFSRKLIDCAVPVYKCRKPGKVVAEKV